MRGKERRERIRQAGRKGVARNILASPRAPSCVLNHFPVDSAVCNPIIGVSPPGKLLFYSRTTRAPDVLSCTAIFPLFLFLPMLFLFACFPSLVPLFTPTAPKLRLRAAFFPTTFPLATPNSARQFVYFALLDPYRPKSYPSGFRKPRLRAWKLNDREGNENGCTRVRKVNAR